MHRGYSLGSDTASYFILQQFTTLCICMLSFINRRRLSKQLDIVRGEVAMIDMASSTSPVTYVSGQVYANPLATPHSESSSAPLYTYLRHGYTHTHTHTHTEPA